MIILYHSAGSAFHLFSGEFHSEKLFVVDDDSLSYMKSCLLLMMILYHSAGSAFHLFSGEFHSEKLFVVDDDSLSFDVDDDSLS